jgi:hypothetical protein
MNDRTTTIEDNNSDIVINPAVISMAPAVSMGTNMLAMASAVSRDYSNATNQQQLNYTMAMVAAMQSYGRLARCDARSVDEAMDLLKQVLAAVQSN